jgi:PPOX class probable F420-dependent enzyme
MDLGGGVMIDLSTEFGQRVQRRLKGEQIIWLTTVGKDGRAHPRPVWFYWQEDEVLIYSQPNTFKLEHIHANSQVALNFDGDGRGGDIVVFSGSATIDPEDPPANEVLGYIEKYAVGLERIGMTSASFAGSYSVAVRIKLESLRGH